ncbi:hypothetical protein LTR66_013738, partial [Elasticomyces elasticus]
MPWPYICSTCRRNLVRNVLRPNQQYLAGINRSSGALLTRGASTAIDDLLPTHDQERVPEATTNTQPLAPRRRDGEGTRSEAPLSQISSSRRSKQPQDFRRQHEPAQAPPTTGPKIWSHITRDSLTPAHQLDKLLKQRQTLDAWGHFLKVYGSRNSPALKEPPTQDLPKLADGEIFGLLLSRVIKTWYEAKGHTAGPSPREAVTALLVSGVMRPRFYVDAIWQLLLPLLDASCVLPLQPEASKLEAASEQVCHLWRLCMQRNVINSPPRELAEPGFWNVLPSLTWLSDIPTGGRYKDFATLANTFLPPTTFRGSNPLMVEKSEQYSLPALLLATCDTLKQQSTSQAGSVKLRDACQPLLEFVDTLRKRSLVSHTLSFLQTGLRLKGVAASIIAGVRRRMGSESLQEMANATEPSENEVGEGSQSLETVLIRRLGRALEQEDLDRVEKLWKDIEGLASQSKAKAVDEQGQSITRPVYEHAMLAFMQLRRPQQAIEVWNAMTANGVQPTVHTWTIMLKGCHKSRDTSSLENIWQRMRTSGVQPDAQAWSTRLYGLMRYERVQQGLAALSEMGTEWINAVKRTKAPTSSTSKLPRGKAHGKKAAATPTQAEPSDVDLASLGDIDGIPKPNTVVINTCISALASSQKFDHIPKILAWSRRFGIEPDVITYNTLIHTSLHHENIQEAINTLSRMQSENIQPDSNTFTILLSALFH